MDRGDELTAGSQPPFHSWPFASNVRTMLACGLVTLMVSDMDRSKVFYRDVLGLREKANYSDWAEYAAPERLHRRPAPSHPRNSISPEGRDELRVQREGHRSRAE